MQGQSLTLREERCAGSMQSDYRSSRILPHDFEIVPSQLLANPGAEGFADCFLGGKSGGNVRGWPSEAEAVRNFFRQQDSLEETLPESTV
jgi:hypothetical protein